MLLKDGRLSLIATFEAARPQHMTYDELRLLLQEDHPCVCSNIKNRTSVAGVIMLYIVFHHRTAVAIDG